MKTERHIFLTGFMGAGKTTLGRGLASLMNIDFVDLDEYITEKEQADTRELFEQRGEDEFRRIESARLAELISGARPRVIALGGGSVCLDSNLRMVKDAGLLIYLRLPATELYRRLQAHTDDRPLLRGLRGDELRTRINQLLDRRQKYYNQAHVVVNALNLTPHTLYREISASLQATLG